MDRISTRDTALACPTKDKVEFSGPSLCCMTTALPAAIASPTGRPKRAMRREICVILRPHASLRRRLDTTDVSGGSNGCQPGIRQAH
jgi:hypothetical protein